MSTSARGTRATTLAKRRRPGIVALVAAALMLILGTVGATAASPAGASPAWTGWKAIPGGQQTQAGPSPISFGGRFYVFVRNGDGAVAYTSRGSTGWSAWVTIPGTVTTASAPTVIVHKNVLQVFIRGANDGIYRSRLVNGGWTTWKLVPGGGLTDQTPAAAVVGGVLYLIVRALDGQIAQIHLDANGWSAWSAVPGGGETNAGPTAVVYGKQLRVIVRGFENRLYLNSRTSGGTWSGWGEIADGIGILDPYAVTYDGLLYLFQAASNQRMYWRTFNGTSWTAFTQEPDGLTNSRPAAVKHGTRLWAVVRDVLNGIDRNRF